MKKMKLKPYSWVECSTPEIQALIFRLAKENDVEIHNEDKLTPDFDHVCVCPNGGIARCHISMEAQEGAVRYYLEDFVQDILSKQKVLVELVEMFNPLETQWAVRLDGDSSKRFTSLLDARVHFEKCRTNHLLPTENKVIDSFERDLNLK